MSDKKKVTRYEIQKKLNDDVTTAIEKCLKDFGLDPQNPDANRRIFRALVTLGAARLMDLGAPPQVIAQQAFEAIGSELKHRSAEALTKGQPFGLLPPAEA